MGCTRAYTRKAIQTVWCGKVFIYVFIETFKKGYSNNKYEVEARENENNYCCTSWYVFE